MIQKIDVLKGMSFGQQIAEEEANFLESYFVETNDWRRVYSGDVDIIYGAKGSGKSAIYQLLVARTSFLFDKNVILIPGENPRGTPAFRDLQTNPPASEREFMGLWKLYFLSLLYGVLEEFEITGPDVTRIGDSLSSVGLVRGRRSLQSILMAIMDYVRRTFRPESVEMSMDVNPVTQQPVGYKAKITFAEPDPQATSQGVFSVDSLLVMADAVFKSQNLIIWVLLDRLDVAFTENIGLEKNALRALFRTYLDMTGFANLRLKIFLRTDIWERLTAEGFREASHIIRSLTIEWSNSSLLNLVVLRALHNSQIKDFYHSDSNTILVSAMSQSEFFYRMCPDQVDTGPNKPKTFDWLTSRTRDATKRNAPRELIHLMNHARELQIRRLELGQPEPEGERIFSSSSFKEALPEVSKTRLEQTLYAEYPSLHQAIEQLRGSKSIHTQASLASIWKTGTTEAATLIDSLVKAGFIEIRRKESADTYWIPFLYRDALDLVQGSAE
jgi:hypothetical protein